MVFSSLLFLFVFLPLFLLGYYVIPAKFRNLLLFLASLLFYAWGEPIYVSIMLFSTLLDYTCGRIIHHYRNHSFLPKIGLGISLLGNLGLLCYFKYANFFITNINTALGNSWKLIGLTLPIGISFYTFQTMSYTIDLYRGKISVQKNMINFGAYVTMFPQLIAGPIVTYNHIEKEINHRSLCLERFSEGSIRFIEGLGKKVLLANNIGLLWDQIHASSLGELSVVSAWLGMVAFGLQLYFDFSGYSDMAIGLGHMLGFSFPENFNYPYISKSVTEFWRRWHITLGSWFREYIYISLGGNRVGTMRFYFNLFVVWFLTGFWHGAGWNFIIWGLFFGVIMVIERGFLLKLVEKLPSWISHIYLLFIILVSWVFFSHEQLGNALTYLSIMFGNASAFINTQTLYELSNYYVLIFLGSLFATPLICKIKRKLPGWILYFFYVGILILCTAYLVDATYNPFLYFRF